MLHITKKYVRNVVSCRKSPGFVVNSQKSIEGIAQRRRDVMQTIDYNHFWQIGCLLFTFLRDTRQIRPKLASRLAVHAERCYRISVQLPARPADSRTNEHSYIHRINLHAGCLYKYRISSLAHLISAVFPQIILDKYKELVG